MGEGKAAGGKTLRNIPGAVDAQEKEWNAARGRARQRGQPMRDLLVARSEPRAEKLDVIAREFRRLVEFAVGHHQGGGEIIGERDPQQPAAEVVAGLELLRELAQQRIAIRESELIGRLERAAGLIHDFRNHQLPAVVVIPAQPLAHDFERQDANPDAVLGAQMFRNREEQLMAAQRQIGGKGLGRLIEFGEMVALGMENGADPIDRAFSS